VEIVNTENKAKHLFAQNWEALLRVTRDLLQSVLEQMAIIQECRSYRGPEALGATIGELDALRELQRLFDGL
jgi:hypothetical protein